MRPIRVGLAVALMLLILAPMGAMAAAAKAPATPAISKESRTKGMADAPALIAASGTDCQLDDARFIGDATDAKTKAKQAAYEVACKGSEGFLMIKKADGVSSYTCLQSDQPGPDGKPSGTQCLLPGNQDPKAGLLPFIAKTKIACAPDKMRAMGQSPTKAFFEVTCTDNPGGFIVITSAPLRLDQPVIANPCVMFAETANIKCEMTDRAKQLSVVDKLNAASGKPCVIKDDGRGFIGAAQSGKVYYEEACSDGKGFILVQAANGGFSDAVPCAEADAIFGGCKLTDARQAKTEQAGLYTDLSKKAGFNCAVSGYAPLPGLAEAPDTEVVELACSNRPDGGIGFFGATAANPSGVYDCAHAELLGYRCTLSKASAAFASLTDDLKSVGKSTCTVSAARAVGITADKKGFIEVGCSDGLPGYMLQYAIKPPSPLKADTAILCSQASGIAGGCTLPGNTAKKS
jgi:hypothetical protein